MTEHILVLRHVEDSEASSTLATRGLRWIWPQTTSPVDRSPRRRQPLQVFSTCRGLEVRHYIIFLSCAAHRGGPSSRAAAVRNPGSETPLPLTPRSPRSQPHPASSDQRRVAAASVMCGGEDEIGKRNGTAISAQPNCLT